MFEIINLASILITFESEWESSGEGSESLIPPKFSPVSKTNGKLMQKVLNH